MSDQAVTEEDLPPQVVAAYVEHFICFTIFYYFIQFFKKLLLLELESDIVMWQLSNLSIFHV